MKTQILSIAKQLAESVLRTDYPAHSVAARYAARFNRCNALANVIRHSRTTGNDDSRALDCAFRRFVRAGLKSI